MTNTKVKDNMDYSQLNVHELIELILEKYHGSTKAQITEIMTLFEELLPTYQDEFPFLREMYELFQELVADLIPHLKKEELVLFPLLKDLEAGKSDNSVSIPIAVMTQEHDSVGLILKQIAMLAKNYTHVPDDNPKLLLLFSKLKFFEKQMFEHIFLENNILFPKATTLQYKTD